MELLILGIIVIISFAIITRKIIKSFTTVLSFESETISCSGNCQKCPAQQFMENSFHINNSEISTPPCSPSPDQNQR